MIKMSVCEFVLLHRLEKDAMMENMRIEGDITIANILDMDCSHTRKIQQQIWWRGKTAYIRYISANYGAMLEVVVRIVEISAQQQQLTHTCVLFTNKFRFSILSVLNNIDEWRRPANFCSTGLHISLFKAIYEQQFRIRQIQRAFRWHVQFYTQKNIRKFNRMSKKRRNIPKIG